MWERPEKTIQEFLFQCEIIFLMFESMFRSFRRRADSEFTLDTLFKLLRAADCSLFNVDCGMADGFIVSLQKLNL